MINEFVSHTIHRPTDILLFKEKRKQELKCRRGNKWRIVANAVHETKFLFGDDVRLMRNAFGPVENEITAIIYVLCLRNWMKEKTRWRENERASEKHNDKFIQANDDDNDDDNHNS